MAEKVSQEVQEAVTVARRFIGEVDKLKVRIKTDPYLLNITGCKESAAVKRASLDLTRALSTLRKAAIFY